VTVGLLIITHNQIGSELLNTATRMLGYCPLAAASLNVTEHDDPDQLSMQAQCMADQLDTGWGLLILTDLFGSTPANIAHNICQHHMIKILTGINLPMLVRVLNYPTLDLDNLAYKALSGGLDGVILCGHGEQL
jgi:PTS system ascorbate-specific IIA component